MGDFKSNRVKHFTVTPKGAGFSLQWKDPLLQSSHRNFRPVDVKTGPDGAIYVVDWYNPITCHQDDRYRDPRRDKAHGRIWRLSSAAPALKPENLRKITIAKVLDCLKAPENWTRYQAKRELTNRDATKVGVAIQKWVRSLDPKLPRYEHHLYEALGAFATIEKVEPGLLQRLLQASDYRARAFASRLVGRWHDRLPSPLKLLAPRVLDEHPQVRLEAVMACAAIPSAKSITVLARVVDLPMDEWIQYAFEQAVHHLRSHWLPAFKKGEISFANPNQLAAVLNKVGGPSVIAALKKLVIENKLPTNSRSSAISAILAYGGPEDWKAFAIDSKLHTVTGKYNSDSHENSLHQLTRIAKLKKEMPTFSLNELLSSTYPKIQEHALTLIGVWKHKQSSDVVLKMARSTTSPMNVRRAAFRALVELRHPNAKATLISYTKKPNPFSLRQSATESMVELNLLLASRLTSDLLQDTPDSANLNSLVRAFLNRDGGAESLEVALQRRKLKPKIARKVLQSLFESGHSHESLVRILTSSIGETNPSPKYSDALVQRILQDAKKFGQANRGKILFKSMACISCHRVGGTGGVVGPDLTSIGTTLTVDRIIEEVIWPNRQIKEGYSVVQVSTAQGRVFRGYERKTRDSQKTGDLVLQDPGTQKFITIKKKDIEEKLTTGSMMPTGLTALLSREQLLDLIRYLAELGKIKQ